MQMVCDEAAVKTDTEDAADVRAAVKKKHNSAAQKQNPKFK